MVPGKMPVSKSERNVCQKHKEIFAYYCHTCQNKLCGDCVALSRFHMYHLLERIDTMVQKEKEKLKGKLEETAKLVENFAFNQTSGEEKSLEIELKWQKMKDHIRQEFVSFHEMLIEKEKELLQQVDEAVTDALCNLEIRVADDADLEKERQKLEESCASALLLQPDCFLEVSKEKFKSVEDLRKKVLGMSSQADIVPAFLDLPFSLHREKVHLHNSITFDSLAKPRVQPCKPEVELPAGTFSVPLSQLFVPPTPLPPSTSLHYRVSLHGVDGQMLWKTIKAKPSNTIQFGVTKAGQNFLVKVTPVYVCSTSNTGQLQSIVGHTARVSVCFTDSCGAQNMQQQCLSFSQSSSPNEKQESSVFDDNGRFHVCREMMEDSSFEEARWRHYSTYARGYPVSPNGRWVPFVLADNGRFHVCKQMMENTSFEMRDKKHLPGFQEARWKHHSSQTKGSPFSGKKLSSPGSPKAVKPVCVVKKAASKMDECERFHILRGMLEKISDPQTVH